MFGFSKKKEQEDLSQRKGASNIQSTKVEDELTSFEIPDFSDDDLNFDLGIGEFMQGGKSSVPPQSAPISSPSPTEQIPNPGESSKLQQIQNTIQNPEAPSAPSFNSSEENKSELQISQDEKEARKQDISDSIEEIEQDTGDEEEELPKFNISSSFSNLTESEAPITEVKVSKQVNNKEKIVNEQTKKETHPKQEKHYAQASVEGFFVPKDVYKKIVILADDTQRKSIYGSEVKNDYNSLLKEKENTIVEMTNTVKSLRDSILVSDAKLFGNK